MPQRVSGKRYAQAIFELALEHDQLNQWAGDLQLASSVLQDEEFSTFLKHAEVPAADKTKALDAVLTDIHPLVRNLLNIVVGRHLVDSIPEIESSYTELLDRHLGRQRVEVTTAVTLGDRELERITRFVTDLVQREVVVTTHVDESVLGGVVIQIGDRLLDGSTRSKLNELRKAVHAPLSAAEG